MTIALNNAISGLRAAQRSLDVISNNVSNAGVEGYTRKILPQETLLIGGEGAGVRLQAILRKVDMTLMRDLVKQSSVSSGSATTETYLSRIQQFHGASEAERSVAARMSGLNDAFSELSTAPEDPFKLSNVVNAATEMAVAMNKFDTLLTQMRNDIQDDISFSIASLNDSLRVVAELNQKISALDTQGRSTAELEDERDRHIQNVAQYMELSTYSTENKKIVLMTRGGVTLADELPRTVSFDKTPASSGSYYPGGGINGILVDGVDVTSPSLGGSLGSMITLRDTTLPTYQAQMDELAQKTAERFDRIGLKLFTDANRQVPPSTTPPTPVSYVGFAGQIRVNPDIVDDPTLLRAGTYGQTALPGSNEMIRKVLDFAFGMNFGQTVTSIDISTGTLFAAAGLSQQAQRVGTVDLTDYTPDLGSAPNLTLPGSFELSIGGTAYAITINPGDSATDLVNTINTVVGSSVAGLNGLGQLRLNATADIAINDLTLGAAGLADLGLTTGTTLASNPSFTVQVGTQSPVTVTIAPGDTAANLLATLNAIPGLTATLGGGGELVMTPVMGGSITIANASGTPIQGLNLAVTNIAHTAFRTTGVGADGSLSTGLIANSSFGDYARSILASQSEDHATAVTRRDRESTYYDTLKKRLSDESGVNIDQELSELIRVQTAYSAAARMITAAEQMMDELFAAF